MQNAADRTTKPVPPITAHWRWGLLLVLVLGLLISQVLLWDEMSKLRRMLDIVDIEGTERIDQRLDYLEYLVDADLVRNAPDPYVVEFLGGEAAAWAVADPEKVSVYLIDQDKLEQWDYQDIPLDDPGLLVRFGPVAVESETGAEISRILRRPSSYGSLLKSCLPQPGVGVRFVRGSETVDVLFCFECNILLVYHDGTFVSAHDFDVVAGQLARIVKQVFPNDAKIAALEEGQDVPYVWTLLNNRRSGPETPHDGRSGAGGADEPQR